MQRTTVITSISEAKSVFLKMKKSVVKYIFYSGSAGHMPPEKYYKLKNTHIHGRKVNEGLGYRRRLEFLAALSCMYVSLDW